MNTEIEKLLETIYFDAANPGSFGGVDRLKQEAAKLQPKINKSDITNFLKNQDSYTLHRDIVRKFDRQPTIVPGIDAQWQADLVVMPAMAEYNDGFPNILTVIDVFSKYAWAIPLKNKDGRSVIAAFKL